MKSSQFTEIYDLLISTYVKQKKVPRFLCAVAMILFVFFVFSVKYFKPQWFFFFYDGRWSLIITSSKAKCGVTRGWVIFIWTGLNIKIGIAQKVWKVMKLFYCQNSSLMRQSFWQKNSLVTHILFELCLFWYVAHSQILGNTLYKKNWIKKLANPTSVQ